MNTIKIVKNSDRCHVSVNDKPIMTFMYSDYKESKDVNRASHALHDAMAQCFITLSAFNNIGEKTNIDTNIVTF